MSVSYGGDSITFADNSTISSGWSGFKNRLINGAMVIDQRNAGAAYTLSTTQNFSCDRWKCWSNITSGSTVQQVSDAPAGFTKSIKITVGTGASPGVLDYGRLWQVVEGYNWADMRWGFSDAKPVTISFWVKSSLTGTFGVGVYAGTVSYFTSYVINSANTWEYKTVTLTGYTSGGTTEFPIDNSGAVAIGFDLGEGSTRSNAANTWTTDLTYSHFGLTGGTKVLATSGATWQVTGVQVEKGSTASSFEYRPYGTELALCQRYYGSYPQTNGTYWYNISTGGYRRMHYNFPVIMRTGPTCTVTGATNNNPSGSLAIDAASVTTCVVSWNHNATDGLVSWNSSALITASAEL